ncbi:hypothetical protein AHMF7616_03047 [Adhaeribacter pallidiroseus]|uniref:Uncharacterized protein n=1 Tax=Adhaeribacter pallidiroseus TaxID=2072847 RepID=A0A369QHP5_9BACT|nr:hypothetical protein AHMF7616_03047 [Adhaeribacter pallidiroseus]
MALYDLPAEENNIITKLHQISSWSLLVVRCSLFDL